MRLNFIYIYIYIASYLVFLKIKASVQQSYSYYPGNDGSMDPQVKQNFSKNLYGHVFQTLISYYSYPLVINLSYIW